MRTIGALPAAVAEPRTGSEPGVEGVPGTVPAPGTPTGSGPATDGSGPAGGTGPDDITGPSVPVHSTAVLPPSAPAPVDPASFTPWSVTRAGLVDINPIARLLQDHRPFIDLDGDGNPDGPADPERAAPATRLVLSHGALEHGEVWCARDEEGVAAAAVWMPPDAHGLADGLHRVVARELGVPAQPPTDLTEAPLQAIITATSDLIAVLRGTAAQRVLITLADADRAGEHRIELLADVLSPVIGAELSAGREVFAVTVDPTQIADLTALGFREVRTAPLGAASLWLGTVHPSVLPATEADRAVSAGAMLLGGGEGPDRAAGSDQPATATV